jgi:hypothetical protein
MLAAPCIHIELSHCRMPKNFEACGEYVSTFDFNPPEIPFMQPSTQRLIATYRASRVSFTWLGTRKALDAQQRDEVAETFGAEGQFLSAGKKLLDTKHPAYRAVNSLRGRIASFWKGISLPYPEPGIRLIRETDIVTLDAMLGALREQLHEAVEGLEEVYRVLKSRARDNLGRLYNDADYPDTLRGLFDISWDFPSVEPPTYLATLSPEIYEQERQRAVSRFDEAVRLAEDGFAAELAKLVGTLTERLAGDEHGQPKSFRDNAVNNLSEFFERFRTLFAGIHDSSALELLVDQAQNAVRGVSADDLRNQADLRRQVAANLSAVGAQLEGMMVDRPRRKIQRSVSDPVSQ